MTLRSRILLAAAMAAVFALTRAAAEEPLSADDISLLDRSLQPKQDRDASERTSALGRAQSLPALDHLIETHNFIGLNTYLSAYAVSIQGRNAEPSPMNTAIEERALASFGRRDGIANVLLPTTRVIDDPRLWEAMYAEIRALATLRAERRAHCHAQVVSLTRYAPARGPIQGFAVSNPAKPEFRDDFIAVQNGGSVKWKYSCAGMKPDDPATDLDGRARLVAPITRVPLVPLDVLSLASSRKVTLPDAEKRLAPLLLDLSLPPPTEWIGVERPSDALFPPLMTSSDLLGLLRQRKYSPGIGPISELLGFYEPVAAPSLKSGGPAQDAIFALLQLAVIDDSRQGYELVAHWLPLVAEHEEYPRRGYTLSVLIPALAKAAPDKRVDLQKTKLSVLERLPYNEIASVSQTFDTVIRWTTTADPKPAPASGSPAH